MGMSASQVRFLSLQHRKHNVGRQLNALSNRKMSLARDMQQVSRNYTNALNQINLKFSNNSGMNNYDLSYDLLMKPNALNCETPYIITDKEGRVVVDDNEVTYEKDGQTFHTGVSYRQLAQLISSYSGVDDDGNIIYNATDRLADFSGALFGENGYSINKAATSGLACGVDNGYKIAMKQSDYDYSIAMRYDILNRLGIITEDEYNNFGAIQKAYYGTKDARDNNLYATVTINDTKGTQAYYNEQLIIKAQNEANKGVEGYVSKSQTSDIFGTIKALDMNGGITVEGGCTLGNIELVKKLIEEYDLYLNTTIKQRSTPDTEKMKNDYKTDVHDYLYDLYQLSLSAPDQGVTNRVLELLTNPAANRGDDFVDENGYYKSESKTISGASIANKSESIIEMLGDKDFMSILDRDLFDLDGDYNTHGFIGYYAVKNDQSDAIKKLGETSVGNHDSSVTTKSWAWLFDGTNDEYKTDVFASISGIYTNGDSDYCNSHDLYCNMGNLSNIASAITQSLAGRKDAIIYDEAAAKYAETMTVIKFMNNYRVFEDRSEYNGYSFNGGGAYKDLQDVIKYAQNNQIGNWDDDRDEPSEKECYQAHAQSVYYRDTKGNRAEVAIEQNDRGQNGVLVSTSDYSEADEITFQVNMANFIKTYFTFYTAYIESNGAPQVTWLSNGKQYGTDGQTYDMINKNDNYSNNNYIIGSIQSVSYLDAHGNSKDKWEDKKNNITGENVPDNLDDSTSFPISKYASAIFNDDGSGKDKEYGISRNVFNYLQNFDGCEVNDSFENSSLSDDEKKELRNLVNTSYGNDSDENISIRYMEINNLARNIQNKYHVYTASDSLVNSCETVSTETKTVAGITTTATATKVTDKNGKMLSFDVEFTYSGNIPEDANYIRRYSEKFDNGVSTGAKIEYMKVASLKYITGDAQENTTGIRGLNSGGWTAVEINSGNNIYYIGLNADKSVYCDYMYVKPQDNGLKDKLKQLLKDLEEQAAEQQKQMQDSFNNIENKVMEYFDSLFKRISENGWVYDEKVNTDNTKASANYLNTMLQNNQYLLTEAREINENGKYQYAMKQATSVNKIYQVHDEDAENAAFAVYESEKTAISNKERQIDTRMNMLETEQEAINTELESIKKVRNDNIDKYFKIFA